MNKENCALKLVDEIILVNSLVVLVSSCNDTLKGYVSRLDVTMGTSDFTIIATVRIKNGNFSLINLGLFFCEILLSISLLK